MNTRALALVFALVLALPGPALAFEVPARLASLGILEAVFIGLAAYFAVRLISNFMKRNKSDQDGPSTYDITPRDPDSPPGGEEEGDGMDRRRAQARAMWQHYGGEQDKPAGKDFGQTLDRASGDQARPEPLPESPPESPAGPAPSGGSDAFDEADFLRGAKAMYVRLRKSWAGRDMEDLAQFSTPAMQARFAAWAAGNPDPEEFDALLVNASLAEIRHEGGQSVAEVRYEATVTDNPKARQTRTVQEMWRFVKNDADPGATWKLDDWQTVQ